MNGTLGEVNSNVKSNISDLEDYIADNLHSFVTRIENKVHSKLDKL